MILLGDKTLIDIENCTSIEWFTKLKEDGTLPTKAQVMETVATTTAMYAPTEITEFLLLTICEKRNCRFAYAREFSWPLMTQEVVSDLAEFFDGKTVLEVCAGNGYIAKCITDMNPNIKIICTDSYEWEDDVESFVDYKRHFYEVERLDAIDAIEKYSNVDYILMSWPPYKNPVATNVLKECIKLNIPLVYIGEPEHGCTSDGAFFELIKYKCFINMDITEDYIPFNGLHDDIYLITPIQNNL